MLRCLVTTSRRALSVDSVASKPHHVICAFQRSLQALPAVTFIGKWLHSAATPYPHVCTSVDPGNLRVRWSDAPDALPDVFPLVWLRTHCQCPKCFHPETLSRRVLGRQLRLSPKVTNCVVKEDHIEILWEDGHESSYRNQWLKNRSFRQPQEDPGRVKQKSWGSFFSPKVYDFTSMLSSDSVTLEFLVEFLQSGICILQNTPKDALECLSEAIFDFPMKTHYGEYFEVKTKPLPSNLAYTSAELGLHNDLPFLRVIPHIQVLHCLLQTDDLEGGANTFSDVSFVVKRMRNEYPEALKLLSEEKASYVDVGKDMYSEFYMRWNRPILTLDPVTNDLVEVAYNHAVLDSFLNIHRDRVKPWFEALALFQDLLVEESIRWRLQTGELVLFDNRRCLHGREGYRATSERHLRGCYFLLDHAESKLRVLHNRIKQASTSSC